MGFLTQSNFLSAISKDIRFDEADVVVLHPTNKITRFFFLKMTSRSSARSSARLNAEKRMVRQREREYDHQATWNDQVRYYKICEKTSNKFDEWTSPRYYATNNQLIESQRKQRERKESLEKRKEKLKKLLEEEDRSYQIELMVKNRYTHLRDPAKKNEPPTELLKDLNLGIKVAEEDRRRHEAELSLYHHWRQNNPVLREYERGKGTKDMKLSWLDQQIEKRLQSEKAEEECRRILAERDQRIKEEREKEEAFKREISERNQLLKEDLHKQIGELQNKQKRAERLQKEEEEHAGKLNELEELAERQRDEEKKRVQREVALENIKQHKLKLKSKAKIIEENLEDEKHIVQKLLDSQLTENIENEAKKNELKTAMNEFLKFARDQQELEKQRQKHFDFVFDSEAKSVYERQLEVWASEQNARAALLQDVQDTLKEQIQQKIETNKQKQRDLLEERQDNLKLIEDYDKDIRRNKEEEQRKLQEWKKGIEEQIKEKAARKMKEKLDEAKKQDLELTNARKEEERLRHEIVELQRRQGPIRHTKSRILY